jgi:hypothetical protein
MGFETQEDAERWAENVELRRKEIKEERMFEHPKERAWRILTELPAFKDTSPAARELQRAIFDYAWDAAMRTNP